MKDKIDKFIENIINNSTFVNIIDVSKNLGINVYFSKDLKEKGYVSFADFEENNIYVATPENTNDTYFCNLAIARELCKLIFYKDKLNNKNFYTLKSYPFLIDLKNEKSEIDKMCDYFSINLLFNKKVYLHYKNSEVSINEFSRILMLPKIAIQKQLKFFNNK